MEKYKRKKLNMAVKKEFQRWLLVRISGTVLLCAGVAALVLYFYSRQEIGDSFYTAHIKVRRVSDLLLPVILAGSAVSLLSGILLALFLPQKVAGPLFRVEQELEKVAEGDLTVRVTLRENDTLQDFAGVVSQTVDDIRRKVKVIQDGLVEGASDEARKQALAQLERLKT